MYSYCLLGNSIVLCTYIRMYVHICTLTVQDIIISNPLKSAGVIELEVVMSYSDGGPVKNTYYSHM